ncbi:MAG: lasso peptide biosynthesis B2 protein [Gemmatimonadota bacterium]|nr:lasso peptide biosynthesis B2 protein [Gemmatimonadota bacterium]
MNSLLSTGWRVRATVAALVLPPLVHLVPLNRLTGWVSPRPGSRRHDASVAEAEVAAWVDAVLVRLPWPWRRTCLKRALTIFALLARSGDPAELRVGVRREGDGTLAAHAWLTRAGQPVLEDCPAQIGHLRVISTFTVAGELK